MSKSTRSSLFPDVNVWIALTYAAHQHHRIAAEWIDQIGPNSRIYFCRLTQLGLLRLLCQPAVMGKNVLTQREAWAVYDYWMGDSRVAFAEETGGIEDTFRGLTDGHTGTRHKDWADAYLNAFAQANELTLVTFDQAMAARAIDVIALGRIQ